jgi:3-oxoadipate enol-lactonase
METRFIGFDHARIAVHVHGTGPLAVLLHGYPLDHRMWLQTLQGPLAAQRTLVAIDLRGHGHSPYCGDTEHSMAMFADDVAAVIHTLTDDRIDLVGLSMGGYIAQEFAHRHRPLLRSLALVNTRARADDDTAKKARLAAAQMVVEQGRAALARTMLPKLLAPRSDDAGLLLRARLQTMIEAQPVETIVADLHGLRQRPDYSAQLPDLSLPVLCIAGAADAITPAAELQAMAAAMPQARCVVLPGCGHLTPMEEPAGFAATLAEFWR